MTLRVTSEQLDQIKAKIAEGVKQYTPEIAVKVAKYRNQRVTIDGHQFASKAEGARYVELKLMEKAGLVAELQLQPVYDLSVGDCHICNYVADFAYMENGRFVVEDVKGVATPVYQLKKKLLYALYGIAVKEVRKA
jgi:hypothetical protein